MGMIDSFTSRYEFLANFYQCAVRFDGDVYPTAEHAFQSAKTLDREAREPIRLAASPAVAKYLGRAVALRSDWEGAKISVMEEIVRVKSAVEPMRSMLLETGDAELIEGNHWEDRVWGCTRDEKGAWIGKNWLGKILMQVRQELREGN